MQPLTLDAIRKLIFRLLLTIFLVFQCSNVLANWSGYEKKIAHFGENEIAYRIRKGSDMNSIIVLIHGYGGSMDNFTAVAEYIPINWTVVVMDVLGFGSSSKVPIARLRNIPFHVKSMKTFLSSIGVNHAVFVGNSMGGCIILGLSTRYPNMIDGLIFSAPAVFLPYYCNGSAEEIEIATTDKPVLFIQGQDDKLVKPEMTKRIAQRFQNAPLQILSNCGHVPERLCAKQYLNVLLPFLDTFSSNHYRIGSANNEDKNKRSNLKNTK